MVATVQLSKSQYLKGLQCPLSLWFTLYSRDIKPEADPSRDARRRAGLEVGEWAKKLFPGGVDIKASFHDFTAGAVETSSLIKSGKTAIFEATAIHPGDGSHARADILQKVAGADAWNIIEVKGTTGVEDYHIDDLAFQYRVFTAAGYRIQNCFLMHINNKYVRQGNIDPALLFHSEDVTQAALNTTAKTEQNVARLIKLDPATEPRIQIGKSRCTKPFECSYMHHCWSSVSEYSIFDVLIGKKADEMVVQLGSCEIKHLPNNKIPPSKKIDVSSHLSQGIHIDKAHLKIFLGEIQYPLYFLDYETVRCEIPLFDASRPFQQVPFQFSLHIQKDPGAELAHYSFLHQDRSDPRSGFIEALVNSCGDQGTVIVYNQTFEETVNKQLAEYRPNRSAEILAISARMLDLHTPFQKRWIYHPKQNGSTSIKSTLPAFTKFSYEGMDISNGDDASQQYLNFTKNGLATDVADKLWKSLSAYCALDTRAMKELLDVVRERAA